MKTKWIFAALFLFAFDAHAYSRLAEEALIVDPSHQYLKLLSENQDIIIDHVNSLGFEVYGPVGLKAYLNSKHISFLEADLKRRKVTNDYPTPEDSSNRFHQLAKKFPKLITLTEIGLSVEGRPLTFARITAPDLKDNAIASRPEFKYIANMHGDEIVGRELMLKLIEELASGYGSDKRISQILESTQVYILPSMNPDGAAHQVRYNASGRDLNRDFPDFTTSDNQNTIEGRAPEIKAVMAFQAAHHFKLSANFHGGAEVVNYPWDAQPALFPLDELAQKLSLDYSKRVSYIYNSTEFPNGITNGFAWYVVKGGMQDWSYNWYNDLQLTIELTHTKWPTYLTVASAYDLNRDALLALIEDIHKF